MPYLVFARKWRPQDFDEIVGQAHIAVTLKNAIKLNRVSQAYLFAGPRGVGKTSTARILAKALNCKAGPATTPCNKCPNCLEITTSNSLDVIEIDGASNRGIDEIRALRENIKFAPVNARFKIYIIDEVHQITIDGFNALLKTLEEPPPHVKFIFATTQPHKIPVTILSRCQRFDFRRVTIPDIVKKLKEVAKAENISANEDVFFEIAKASDGSMRDAESILDQLNSFCDKRIEKEDVTTVLGVIEEDLLLNLTDMILKKDITAALTSIDAFTNEGKDLYQFLSRFIEHIRNLTVLKVNKNLSGQLSLSNEAVDKLARQAEEFTLEDLIYCFYLLSGAYEAGRRTGLIRFSLEFALIKIARREGIMPIDELLEKIKGIALSPGHEQDSSKEIRSDDNVEIPPAQELLLSDVENAWEEALRRVSAKKPSIASFLMEGQPTAIENRVIRVDFPKMHRFHKEILEKAENKKIIQDIIKEILNRRVDITFNLVEKLERRHNFTFAADAEEEKKEPVDPAVKDAMDVFKGSVMRNNNGNFKSNG